MRNRCNRIVIRARSQEKEIHGESRSKQGIESITVRRDTATIRYAIYDRCGDGSRLKVSFILLYHGFLC